MNNVCGCLNALTAFFLALVSLAGGRANVVVKGPNLPSCLLRNQSFTVAIVVASDLLVIHKVISGNWRTEKLKAILFKGHSLARR